MTVVVESPCLLRIIFRRSQNAETVHCDNIFETSMGGATIGPANVLEIQLVTLVYFIFSVSSSSLLR